MAEQQVEHFGEGDPRVTVFPARESGLHGMRDFLEHLGTCEDLQKAFSVAAADWFADNGIAGFDEDDIYHHFGIEGRTFHDVAEGNEELEYGLLEVAKDDRQKQSLSQHLADAMRREDYIYVRDADIYDHFFTQQGGFYPKPKV